MQTVAQRGALIFGVVFLVVGVLGLFTEGGTSMDADMETAGRLFGLFPVNLLLNVAHLAFGAWGLAASRDHAASRTYGRIGAAIFAALAVLALADPSGLGLVPIGGNDIWLHAVLAAGLAYIGFGPADAREHTPAA